VVVGYLLRMSAEIRDWLSDLRANDPYAARQVGEALTALLGENGSLGPPLVVSLADAGQRADPREALDESYQSRLEQLALVRHTVADAATLASDLQDQIAGFESLRARLDDRRQRALDEGRTDQAVQAAGELAAAQGQESELRRLLSGVTESERTLNERYARQQARVDDFRIRKESLKARYTAAEAAIRIQEATAVLGQAVGDQTVTDADPDVPVTAAGRLTEISGEIERELRSTPSAPDLDGLCPAPGLLELRPGAPDHTEVRILFAAEPPGTALLIAVLEGSDAVREQYREAVAVASDLLERVRAGLDHETAACAFDDAASFLDEFFPGEAGEVEIGAAALTARIRATTLAEQRLRLALTQAQVADRMNVRPERVAAIERAEPGATEVRTLAAYVAALGGRLEIVADFGGERVVLR
jgi:hypothetical protein